MGSQFSKKRTSPSSYSSPPCTCKCAELKSEPDVPVRDCLDNLQSEKSSHGKQGLTATENLDYLLANKGPTPYETTCKTAALL